MSDAYSLINVKHTNVPYLLFFSHSVSPISLSLGLHILSPSTEKCDEALASPLPHTAFTSSSVFSNGYAPGYAKLNRRGGTHTHTCTNTGNAAGVRRGMYSHTYCKQSKEYISNAGTCTSILMNDFTDDTLRGKCPSLHRVTRFIVPHSCSHSPPLPLLPFTSSYFPLHSQLQPLSQWLRLGLISTSVHSRERYGQTITPLYVYTINNSYFSI